MQRAALLALLLVAPVPASAGAAEPATGGVLGGLLPLSAGDLAGLASGGPMVLEHFETAGGGSAEGTVEIGADGSVAIRTSALTSANLVGSPVTLSGGQLATGGFGAVAMDNSAGIASLQMASGLNNIQQSATSFVFVLSGLPQ